MICITHNLNLGDGLRCPQCDASEALDAKRYRWLRSEEAATDPRFYPFWQEFNAKLCREERMDAAIDAAMLLRTRE